VIAICSCKLFVGADGITECVTERVSDVCNAVVKDSKILEDWSKSWLTSMYKGKGDALECGLYRGIKMF